jgi:predicted enzyme related to lactoylglutathione lyase
MANNVAWVEVVGSDGQKLKDFYSELFDWSFDKVPGDMDYWTHMVENGVGAGVGKAPGGPGHATFYVGVDDPQAALDKAEQLGAKTLVPVTEMEMVTFALIADPEGHTVGIIKNQPPQ